jgi:hypothetical protein
MTLFYLLRPDNATGVNIQGGTVTFNFEKRLLLALPFWVQGFSFFGFLLILMKRGDMYAYSSGPVEC